MTTMSLGSMSLQTEGWIRCCVLNAVIDAHN